MKRQKVKAVKAPKKPSKKADDHEGVFWAKPGWMDGWTICNSGGNEFRTKLLILLLVLVPILVANHWSETHWKSEPLADWWLDDPKALIADCCRGGRRSRSKATKRRSRDSEISDIEDDIRSPALCELSWLVWLVYHNLYTGTQCSHIGMSRYSTRTAKDEDNILHANSFEVKLLLQAAWRVARGFVNM